MIKEYNFSDLYVLFVGHLADRMANGQPFATPWAASTQLRSADVEAMQKHLTRLGLYSSKLDGKAGMQTRAALGAYQKKAGLNVDCWPSADVLRATGDEKYILRASRLSVRFRISRTGSTPSFRPRCA